MVGLLADRHLVVPARVELLPAQPADSRQRQAQIIDFTGQELINAIVELRVGSLQRQEALADLRLRLAHQKSLSCTAWRAYPAQQDAKQRAASRNIEQRAIPCAPPASSNLAFACGQAVCVHRHD